MSLSHETLLELMALADGERAVAVTAQRRPVRLLGAARGHALGDAGATEGATLARDRVSGDGFCARPGAIEALRGGRWLRKPGDRRETLREINRSCVRAALS